MPLNREQIVRTVGDIDDAAVAEIIATGATAEELAEAHAWLANDEPLLNSGKSLPAGRVGRLASILMAWKRKNSSPRPFRDKARAGRMLIGTSGCMALHEPRHRTFWRKEPVDESCDHVEMRPRYLRAYLRQ
jgi:hypothetical protein